MNKGLAHSMQRVHSANASPVPAVGPAPSKDRAGWDVAMGSAGKSPCLPGADLVAKETGNKEVTEQSRLHVPRWPGGRGDSRREGGKEVAQSSAGQRLGLGRGTDCAPRGGPSGLSDASDFP